MIVSPDRQSGKRGPSRQGCAQGGPRSGSPSLDSSHCVVGELGLVAAAGQVGEGAGARSVVEDRLGALLEQLDRAAQLLGVVFTANRGLDQRRSEPPLVE